MAPRKTKSEGNGATSSKSQRTSAPTKKIESEVKKGSSTVSRVDAARIAVRAWEIWSSEGCPHGRDLEHWLRAERELSAAARKN